MLLILSNSVASFLRFSIFHFSSPFFGLCIASFDLTRFALSPPIRPWAVSPLYEHSFRLARRNQHVKRNRQAVVAQFAVAGRHGDSPSPSPDGQKVGGGDTAATKRRMRVFDVRARGQNGDASHVRRLRHFERVFLARAIERDRKSSRPMNPRYKNRVESTGIPPRLGLCCRV